jgi:K+-transporting ATPase c subunit
MYCKGSLILAENYELVSLILQKKFRETKWFESRNKTTNYEYILPGVMLNFLLNEKIVLKNPAQKGSHE